MRRERLRLERKWGPACCPPAPGSAVGFGAQEFAGWGQFLGERPGNDTLPSTTVRGYASQ